MKIKTTSIITAIIMALSFTTIMPMSVFAENDVTDYLQYNELEDGTLEVAAFSDYDVYISPDVHELVIPSEVDEKKVTRIKKCGVNNAYQITSIVLPDTITEIGDHAFSGSTKIESVTLSNNLKTIGDYAFDECESLTNITLPEGLESIGNHAFSSCKKLTAVRIPDSVTSIGEYAFSECENLTDLYVGDSVTELAKNMFFVTKLTNVEIGSGLNNFNDFLTYQNQYGVNIKSNSKIANIRVDEDNETFSSQDGILFNKDKTELIYYPKKDLETYTVPDSVEKIACKGLVSGNLKTIRVPATVTEIEQDAFSSKSVIECYYDSAAQKYAIANKMKYRLLDEPMPQLVKYQLRANDDSTTDTRFILIADEQEVLNSDSASVYATIDGTDTDVLVVNRAYRSIKANGKTITADEGKVFLIGKFIGIPDDMVNGMTAHFTLDENTFERTIA